MFNVLSGLVIVWVGLVKKGTYELEQVPNISNLKEVVSDQINAA
ncbi:hypothetical protein SAMN02787081_01949 [Lysinibacillus fusiformis]|uniref:Uncharacterized protein n=1 Tax=Lysinibacillus fusiformis TaxID=28031 RepID=A0A1H9HA70_9BACI|nr:hypothetical protein SAMN02787078_00553 [Lysinibacillus sp. SG9]SCY30114.1 hypothetical protein SAMN02787081_01949 [Lysinibacillus fusiformis]SDB07129.1 hypothetical protein SAMN02787079_00552 [Lysinibacillus sp. TC-37]SFS39097.1 hypothetical protein SAMN02787087_00557 [Lysinibacillus sp. SG55]SEN53769.1 hypothetical protein SAMN02787103_02072 [Lysinibacillus fusiformis]